MWLEEKSFVEKIKRWWKNSEVNGSAGLRLLIKLKKLKEEIKEWNKNHLGDIRCAKTSILEEIKNLDIQEEARCLTEEELARRTSLKIDFEKKVKEEEISWRQRSRCKWLKEGDKNTKFFHRMASARRRNNRITSLVDGDVRLSDRENIVNHIKDFFATLYAKEEWDIPALDNLQFDSIGEVNAAYLESEFEEAEVREAVFALGGDKALGPDGFPIAFFHRFRHTLKEDIMAFLTEFHLRGKLPNNIGASFITLIPKKQGADRLKDF